MKTEFQKDVEELLASAKQMTKGSNVARLQQLKDCFLEQEDYELVEVMDILIKEKQT